jgi:uncharacterized protein YdcH (DUF465 family)
MEKEAELFRALDHLSKHLSNESDMTTEQIWEVFHICADSAAVYRHITDYFNVLDRKILEARIDNGKLKQEVYDLKKVNLELQDKIDRMLDGF